MLDIANSFLNSPLAQHLSGMESKTSDFSSKDESSNPNTLKKTYSGTNVKVNNFDTRSPAGGLHRSSNHRYDGEDDGGNYPL
mmetsp:Transcript_4/g.7  ORF Transcript_4/g.7 Transcript_4/m.7 type:complete len:82 (-) Transcript_4:686-931(-)